MRFCFQSLSRGSRTCCRGASRNLYKKELTRILAEVDALKDGKTSKLRDEIAGHLRELGEL